VKNNNEKRGALLLSPFYVKIYQWQRRKKTNLELIF